MTEKLTIAGRVVMILKGIGKWVLILFGLLLLDRLPLLWVDIVPPEGLRTIEEFREWQGDDIRGEEEIEVSGKRYTILIGPSSAFLASGRAAYAFDEAGQFVGWTRDSGDYPIIEDGGMKLWGPGSNARE